ncbi:hypothetical protein GUITHDRAFT_113524 [Guillardia theta CCMP2712]|uniref:Vacuolar protein sorting-associated protein 54 N-terminal domain-containing protein n=1 Tax=Guillardia theta (strain CCMP2712) TaxID=905079 RepID=L1IWL4_GUITC|nr:hypothetical protein GUITHDRAFT_113524 [Guillardia theta CCMP2712]EKX40492.1 hypothetical protein GUITHDRAFT_113524 [Guillardia theta CCMP2712]|eukprot:XP_005827472.1 hypothetical protein GUITHDRAFT_113524 [Guillardia theta CCMP2712]
MAESLDSGSLREKMSSSAGRAMNKVKSVMAPTSIANAGVAASELIGVVAAGAMATSEQLVSGLSTVGGGISAVGGKVVGGMDVFWKESPEEDALAQVDEKKWNSWSKQQARQGEVEKTKDRLSLQAKMMSASDRSSMGEGEAQDEEGVWLDFVKLERLKAHACEWDRIGRSEENALIDLLDGLPKDPMEMEEVEFDEVVEEYVRLSDAAQRDLADTCRARWGDFKKGLHEVEMLERELSAAKFVCSKGRSSLNLARIQLEEGNVAAHFRKKQVLQEVCALLSQLVQALDREDRAMEALNGRSPDYALARTLSNECYSFIGIAPPHSPSDPLTHVSEVGEEVGRHVSKLLCAQDVATRLSRLEERFDVKVKDGLKELCKNFDKQTFERIFLAYARNGRQWELGESLHGHFLEGLDKGLQQIIFSTVAADAEEDAVTLLTMSFEQLISRIPAEQMVMALLSCYQHMCELLSSLQSVLLYIRKSMRRAERDAVRVLVSQGMSAGGAQKLLEDEKLAIEECMKGAESVVEPPDLSSAGKGSEAGVLQRSASAEGAEEEAQPAEEETPEKEHEADLPPRQSLDVEAPARMSIDESSTAGSAITNTPSAASQGGERVDGEKAGQSSSVWSRLKAARTMLKTGTPSKGEEAAAHAAGSFSDKAGEHKGAQGEKGKAWRSSGISAMSAMAAAATGAGKAAAGAAQSLATHAHIASHSSDERHSSHAAMAAHEANHLQAPSKIKEKLVRGGFMSETGVASARSSSSVSLPSSIWILELLLNGTHISLWDEAQNRVRSLVTLPKINSLRREEYCKLMAATNRFAKFGEELTRLPATLRGTIWSVCRDYYQMFHRSSILMVQTSIESDFWQPYPTGGGGRLNLATVQELRPFIFWEQEGKGGADARTGMQDSVWSEFFGEVEQGERGGGDVKAEEKKGRGEDSIPQNPFSQLSLESFALPPMPKATASEEEDAEGGGMEDGALVPRQVR